MAGFKSDLFCNIVFSANTTLKTHIKQRVCLLSQIEQVLHPFGFVCTFVAKPYNIISFFTRNLSLAELIWYSYEITAWKTDNSFNSVQWQEIFVFFGIHS